MVLNCAILINDIVYAEISSHYDRIEDLDSTLDDAMTEIVPTPRRSALFLAGKAFQKYRAVGGVRTGVLADCFIGAHAPIEGWPLPRRAARRYGTNFPKVALISAPV